MSDVPRHISIHPSNIIHCRTERRRLLLSLTPALAGAVTFGYGLRLHGAAA